jgi:hypothetical protein
MLLVGRLTFIPYPESPIITNLQIRDTYAFRAIKDPLNFF